MIEVAEMKAVHTLSDTVYNFSESQFSYQNI